jgi:hypothetical protein
MFQSELPGVGGGDAEERAGDRALLRADESGRLAGLLRQHQQLLKSVAGKRRELEKLRSQIEHQAAQVAARIMPLQDRLLVLDREIHALFKALLGKKRLAREALTQLTFLYRSLIDEELLSPPGERDPDPEGASPADDGETGEREAWQADSAGEWQAESGTAPRAAAQRGAHEGLRGMFLRLARALHPDRAQGSHDLSARTEAMKALNLAYEHGDLAGILEIERRWSAGILAASHDLDSRCGALETFNKGLRRQVATLQAELRDLRRSEAGRAARQGRARGSDMIEEMAREGGALIEQLTVVRDQVAAFRDGKLTLEELVEGPIGWDVSRGEDELADALQVFASMMMADEPARPGPRKRRTRKAR